LGGRVQVLKQGTLMGLRGNQLYQLYLQYDGLDKIPNTQRHQLETNIFHMSLDEVWAQTQDFFQTYDPQKLAKARTNEKFKMALVFRWYLGNSSKWAITGEPDRKGDYQIWCGPAIGAFNQWCRGSFLEPPDQRRVRQVALNIMEGAAIVTRAQQCKTFGLAVPSRAFDYRPEPLGL
jgi:PfaD family protein